jgi:hypothetical protein
MHNGIEFFGVAGDDEGIKLRNNGSLGEAVTEMLLYMKAEELKFFVMLTQPEHPGLELPEAGMKALKPFL